MRKIKVILSTNGPLHLIKSAEFLSKLVDIEVIQGWIPGCFDKFLIGIASKIVGRDLSKSFEKRTPECLKGRNRSVALPEFVFWIYRSIFHKDGSIKAAKMYGYLSKRYIKNADIFHVRSGSGFSAIANAQKYGMKVIVDHSIAHPAFMDWQLREEYKKNEIKFNLGLDSAFWQGVIADCEQADCLLVNSEFVKDTFVEQGYNADKIKVVLLGVREDFFRLKKYYDIDKKVKILFTGSWGFRKGAEYILLALQELDRRGFEYEMTVVGNYTGSEALLKKYKPKFISFAGFVVQDELKTYLAKSDIYLFPSLCEGCASSGMEAMAAGLSVIATRESGLPIHNRKDGIIIPSKDVNAIINAVIELYENKILREKLGMAAAKTISENYTWEKYAENITYLYKNILNV